MYKWYKRIGTFFFVFWVKICVNSIQMLIKLKTVVLSEFLRTYNYLLGLRSTILKLIALSLKSAKESASF